MTLQQLKITLIERLSHLYESSEIEVFFWMLLEAFENKKRIDFVLQPNNLSSQIDQWQKAIEALAKGEPIQYVLGYAWFFGLKFMVNRHTLIPRPETEELVEWVLNTIKTKSIKPKNILDIGTGSGCIPISLKKHLKEVDIAAIDVSDQALKVAIDNANYHLVNIHFYQQDIFKPFKLPKKLDIIISNPPYVSESEKGMMHQNVLNFEPAIALFVNNNNPLTFYNRIADFALENLAKNGYLFFEINQYLGHETLDLLYHKGLKDLVLKKDFKGNNRMIRAKF